MIKNYKLRKLHNSCSFPRKIKNSLTTLFLSLIMLLSFNLQAQQTFPVVSGPVNVAAGSPQTVNINDAANTAGIASGFYDSFEVTADWVAGGGNPWSTESDLEIIIAAGSTAIDPPTSGGNADNNPTTLTFSGDFAGIYDPDTDGTLDLILNQSFGGSDADWSNIEVTIFEAPTCIPPTNLAVSNVTNSTADLTWDADPTATTGYDYVLITDGSTPDGTTTPTGSVGAGVTTENLTGLTAATFYVVYVRSDCGAGDLSEWSLSTSFNTPCVTVTAPFSENFDGPSWVSGTGFGNLNSTIDLCWSRNPTDPDFFWGTRTGTTGSTGTGPSGANSGSNYIFTEGSNGSAGDEANLVSPLIDLSTLSQPALTFWYHMFNGSAVGDMGTLSVDVNDGSGYDLDVFTISGTQQTAESDDFIEQIVDLSAYAGLTVSIRFRGIRGNDFESDIAIDDFKVDEAPTCLKPTNLAILDVFFDSLEVSWDPISNATNGYVWEIYNAGDDPSVDAPVSNGTFAAGSSQGIAAGLTPETDYDFYLASDCNTDGQSEFTNPISFTTVELCSLPTTFEVINLLSDSAELSWSGVPNANAGYNWAVFNAGDDPATATPVDSGNAPSGDTSVQVTGLTDNSGYEAYITTDCGTDGTSDQSTALAFTTPCTVFTAPITENFDGSSWVSGTAFGNTGSVIDDCWSRNPTDPDFFWGTRTGTTGSGATGPSTANSGSNYIFTEGSNGSTGDEANLVSPLIDLSPLSQPALTFWYHMFGSDMGTLSVDVNDGSGYDLDVFTISGQQQAAESDNFIEQIVDLSAYAGQTVTIRFRGIKGADFETDMAIDDFKVDEAPSCLTPTGLAVSNVTTNTADLDWSSVGNASAGYIWSIYNLGDDPAVDTPVATGSVGSGVTTVNVTGLPSSSTLEAYIQSDCGNVDGESDLSFAVEFETLCDVFSTPFIEDFNTDPTSIPNCWSQGAGNAEDWLFDDAANIPTSHIGDVGSFPSPSPSAGGFAWVDDSTPHNQDTRLESPFIDVSGLTVPALTFYFISDNEDSGVNSDFRVEVWDGAAWNEVFFSDQNSANADWEEVIVDLSTLTITGDIQLAFIIDEDDTGNFFDDDVAIDDIRVDELPTCLKPVNLSVSNITENSADFAWDSEPTATAGYNWFVFNTGDDPLVDTPVASGSVASGVTSANVTGLPSSSVLDFYVQSECGGGDTSFLSSALTFETLCDVVVAPFVEDFNTNPTLIPLCWSQGAGNAEDWLFDDAANIPISHIGDNGSFPSSSPSAGGFAWVDDSAAHNQDTRLESPFIDVSGLTVPALTFYFISDNEGDAAGNVDFRVEVWDGAAWNEVFFSNQNSVNADWEEVIVDLSSLTITGDIQLAFIVDENNGTGFDDDVAIDDVRVDEAPTCLKPTNLAIVDVFFDSVELSWNPVSNATSGYIWEVYIAGDDPAVDAPVSSGTFAAGTSQGIADGLLPETDYDIYLISDCGLTDGQSLISIPASFTTSELCSLPTTFEVINLLPNSAELTWSAIPNAANGYNWAVFNAGDDPATATPVDSGNAPNGVTSASVTGLIDNSDYEAYITTDCGPDGPSDQSTALAFTTPCTVFTAPIAENFDGPNWVSGTGFGNTGSTIDGCWSRNPTDPDFFWGTRTGTTGSGDTGPSDANSGSNYIFTEGSNGSPGDEANFVSPLIDLSPLSEPALTFWYHMFGVNTGSISVDVNDGSGFDLDVFTISGEQQTAESDDFIEQIVDLSAYSGQIVSIRFRAVKGAGFESDMAIDDFEVDEAPTCFNPLNLSILTVTDTTAELTWDAGSNETIFDVEVVPSGSTPTGVPTYDDVSLPFTATGLNSETTYEVYVRADCGAGDVSDWLGPESFTTALTPVTITVNAPAVNNVYCYDNNEFKEWLFVSSDIANTPPTAVEINFIAGTIEDGMGSDDRFRVFDGFDSSATLIYDSDVDGTDLSGVSLIANSGALYMLLESGIFGSCQSGIDTEDPLDFDVFAGSLSTVVFSEDNFNFYPNPVSSILTVNSANVIESIQVYNLLGQEVINQKYNKQDISLDLSSLSSGTYFMKANINESSQTFKIIKQ